MILSISTFIYIVSKYLQIMEWSKYVGPVCAHLITLAYSGFVLFILLYEISALKKYWQEYHCASLINFVIITSIIDTYTLFIGFAYYLRMLVLILFKQSQNGENNINNEIVEQEEQDIREAEIHWTPLGILLFHTLGLRFLNIFCCICYAGELTLKCIRAYKSEAPELLLIYDANIGISVSLIILLCLGFSIIYYYEINNGERQDIENHNNGERQDIENHNNGEIQDIENHNNGERQDIENHNNGERQDIENHNNGEIQDIENHNNGEIQDIENHNNGEIQDIENHNNGERQDIENHNNGEIQDIENTETSDDVSVEEMSIDDNSNNPNITKCCICFSSYDKFLACVPCGHVCVCKKCFNTGNIQKCPACLQKTTGQMKIYLI
jgi:hypothetical protein